MSTSYIIPLTPVPQSLGITIGEANYRFLVRWNNAAEGGWILSILDSETSKPLVFGIPLVAGCDLLAPYKHLNFGGELRLTGNTSPTQETLGKDVCLVFSPFTQN